MSALPPSDGDLRDPALQRALAHAPDHAAVPGEQVRRAIQRMAEEALHPLGALEPSHPAGQPWWRRLWGGQGRRAPLPWAAFATVLVAGIVAALWQRSPVPDARPDGSAGLGGAARVAKAPAPVAAVAPAAASAPTSAAAPSGAALVSADTAADKAAVPPPLMPEVAAEIARSRAALRAAEAMPPPTELLPPQPDASDAAQVSNPPPGTMQLQQRPGLPIGASASRISADLKSARGAPASVEGAVGPVVAVGATPAPVALNRSQRMAPASLATATPPAPAVASAPPAAPTVRTEAMEPPSFAPLAQWTQLHVVQRNGASRSLTREEAGELGNLLGSAALSAVGGAPLSGAVEWRVTLERDGKPIATMEIGRRQVRWRENGVLPGTGTPAAGALAALQRALYQAVSAPRPAALAPAPSPAPSATATPAGNP